MGHYADLNYLQIELLKILENLSGRQVQINLQSKAARETLVKEIVVGLNSKFYFTSYANPSSEK